MNGINGTGKTGHNSHFSGEVKPSKIFQSQGAHCDRSFTFLELKLVIILVITANDMHMEEKLP